MSFNSTSTAAHHLLNISLWKKGWHYYPSEVSLNKWWVFDMTKRLTLFLMTYTPIWTWRMHKDNERNKVQAEKKYYANVCYFDHISTAHFSLSKSTGTFLFFSLSLSLFLSFSLYLSVYGICVCFALPLLVSVQKIYNFHLVNSFEWFSKWWTETFMDTIWKNRLSVSLHSFMQRLSVVKRDVPSFFCHSHCLQWLKWK